MEISPLLSVDRSAENSQTEDSMRVAAEQVEGMFMKILMKEGMQSMLNEAGNSSSALSYALEQAAEEAGRAGSLGIADQIYEQLSANL